MSWRTDGITGDKIIRHRGKLYELWTVKDASSYAGLPQAKKATLSATGKDGVALRLTNTYSYAGYVPYIGARRPKRR